MTDGGPILVLDTATTHAVIALGTPGGVPVEQRSWLAGYRHGEELLARIEVLLADRGVPPGDLGGIVVGTGPGAFTGLRVGIATAKGLAHALGLPVVGVPTSAALIAAAATAGSIDRAGIALLQPAGLSDRVLSCDGEAPRILPGGTEPPLVATLVAVDLDGRAPGDAVARGELARHGLAAALLAAGAARLAVDDVDDLARLAPEYVTLPRGVRIAVGDAGVDVSGGGTRT